MEKINVINKKKVMVCLIALFLIIFLIVSIIVFPKEEKNGLNAVVLGENVKLYSVPEENDEKIRKNISQNSEVKILDVVFENNKEWYLVNIEGYKGYILSQNVDYYGKDTADKVIVADFSEHNFKDTFSSVNDVEAFLLKYNISYVYIRAGGRGYGEKGNFYTDKKYKEFKKACEYLGIKYGYYFLDEALNNKEITEEVEFINDFMKKNKTNLSVLPIALDVEPHDGKGRCDKVWDTRSEQVSKLIKKLESADYEVILYSNANTCNTYMSSLKTKFWLAYYPLESFVPDYWYDKTNQPGASNTQMIKNMVGWQFTENGVKHVIKEGIDLSIFKKDFLNK